MCPESVNENRDPVTGLIVCCPCTNGLSLSVNVNHIAIRARMPSEVEAELIALFQVRVHDVDSFESGTKWWKGNGEK